MSPLPILLRALGAAFALPLIAAPAPPPVGSVIALRNQATIASPPGAAAGAKMKMQVHTGDVVAPGPDLALAQDSGEAETATLILLSDPGEQGGGIDVDATTGITELRIAGQAVFFRRRGEPPRPPRMLPPEFRGQIERNAAPARLGREP